MSEFLTYGESRKTQENKDFRNAIKDYVAPAKGDFEVDSKEAQELVAKLNAIEAKNIEGKKLVLAITKTELARLALGLAIDENSSQKDVLNKLKEKAKNVVVETSVSEETPVSEEKQEVTATETKIEAAPVVEEKEATLVDHTEVKNLIKNMTEGKVLVKIGGGYYFVSEKSDNILKKNYETLKQEISNGKNESLEDVLSSVQKLPNASLVLDSYYKDNKEYSYDGDEERKLSLVLKAGELNTTEFLDLDGNEQNEKVKTKEIISFALPKVNNETVFDGNADKKVESILEVKNAIIVKEGEVKTDSFYKVISGNESRIITGEELKEYFEGNKSAREDALEDDRDIDLNEKRLMNEKLSLNNAEHKTALAKAGIEVKGENDEGKFEFSIKGETLVYDAEADTMKNSFHGIKLADVKTVNDIVIAAKTIKEYSDAYSRLQSITGDMILEAQNRNEIKELKSEMYTISSLKSIKEIVGGGKVQDSAIDALLSNKESNKIEVSSLNFTDEAIEAVKTDGETKLGKYINKDGEEKDIIIENSVLELNESTGIFSFDEARKIDFSKVEGKSNDEVKKYIKSEIDNLISQYQQNSKEIEEVEM